MAEQTLLEIVQTVLSALDSDQVNSIGDTIESNKVARIVQSKYYDILTRGGLPETKKMFQLQPSIDPTRPVQMEIPAGVADIEWIKYFDVSTADSQQQDQFGSFHHDLNTDLVTTSAGSSTAPVAGYKYVTILPMEQFLDMVNRFNPSEPNVRSYQFIESGEDFTFYYKNDIQPKYCTTLHNTHVLFDTFNSNFEDTLQATNTLVYGQLVPPFSLTDTFVPPIDDNQFPLLINEAKSLAFYELKQTPHVKADQEINRQWSAVQKNKSKANKPTYFNQLADFGRVPRTGGYSGGGYGAYKWMRQSGP